MGNGRCTHVAERTQCLTNNIAISDELTELEARVLDRLARTLRPGFCPSREELSRAAGLGGRGYRITKVLDSLEQGGFIRLARPLCRAITVLRWPDGRPFRFETVWVPVVGLIGASHPRQTATQLDNAFADEAIELTRSLLRGRDATFALRVSGDSMTDALVNDGDIVILSTAPRCAQRRHGGGPRDRGGRHGSHDA